ncbi:MAG: hypothetical protein V1734_03685 [Nanoarchaeota archaeon]
MQKEALKRDLQGFLNVSDDNEELYLKRARETNEFCNYIRKITDGNSKELSQYFEGDLNGIQFIQSRGESCALVRDYFSYYPSKYPALFLDTGKALPREFETKEKSKVMPKEKSSHASGFMTYVPFKNAWQPIICILQNPENEKRKNDTLAHELIHVCRIPTLLKHNNFYANEQPLHPIPFFKAEVYAFIVGINGMVADSMINEKEISKKQRRKLCAAIANNDSKAEIEEILGCTAGKNESPLEATCSKLPLMLNMSYNSPNIFRTAMGYAGMAWGAILWNPLVWGFGAMNAMQGAGELYKAWTSMGKEIEIFFKARRKLKNVYGNNTAKAIAGRATIEELEEICNIIESRLNDWVHEKKDFKWQLIKTAAKLKSYK